jgi:hypothetical protein
VETKNFIKRKKLLGRKREIVFKSVLRNLIVSFYYFSSKYQFEKSLRIFEYPLLKCPAYMTIEDEWS